MKQKSKWILGLTIALMIIISLSFGSEPVFAALPTNFSEESQANALVNVRNKVIYSIISDCYNALSENINVTSGYTTWSQIFSNGNADYDIPYYLFSNSTVSKSPQLTCSEIMGGWKNFWGTQTFPGIGYKQEDIPVVNRNNEFGAKEEVVEFLRKIGYEPTTESSNEVNGYRCVSYSGTTPSGKVFSTDKVCAKQSDEDKNKIDLNYAIKVDDVSSDDLGDGNLDTMIFKIKSVEYKDNTLTIPKVGYDSWIFTTGNATHASTDNYYSCTSTYVSTPIQWSDNSGVTYELCYNYGFLSLSTSRLRINGITSMTFTDLARALGSALMTAKEAEPTNFPSFSSQEEMVKSAKIDPAIATGLKKGSLEDYMKYFMGDNYSKYNEELTVTEKYILYWNGLKEVVTANSGAPNGNIKYWLVGTEFKNDYNLVCSSGCKVTTLDRSSKLKSLQAISGSNPTVLELINELDYDAEDFGEVATPEEDVYQEIVDDSNNNTRSRKLCFANSGVLGWILCPIIEAASGIGEHMWNQIEKYHLKIPASEIFKEGGGVRQAWDRIRNLANTIFIILFMIVIFSQLTGVGIDNYGIKRILPKIIIVAITVNLSWIICELAVDLSNILGSGLNSMLTGLAGQIKVDIPSASGVSQATGWAFDLAIGGGGIFLFQLLSTGSLLGAGAAIGIAVLGIVITIVVAMLFLYLILIAREAGIVLAVILAPVAIVCYTLPNTEKLYKKWFDIFKALIVVYPICGAIVGAGQLAGTALASIDSNSMKIAAAIVQVLPFFLVPMILKNSLSLMGNIGGKLSNLGRSIGHRGSNALRSGIQNSERFKDWSNWQKENAAARRAQRTQTRLENLRNRRPLSAREQDRLRKAQDIWLEHRKRQLENQVRSRDGYATAMANKQDLSIEAEADAIARLNDPTIIASERQSLADEARIKRSKARTALLMNQYGSEGLAQLQTRWDTAFSGGDAEELDALTNVITQRYGSSGANSISESLNAISGIARNANYQNSLRTLQRTMNDNSAFAGHIRNKSPDAFQMISDAGMRYDQTANGGAGAMVYEDMNWFTQNNTTATSAKDWSTASSATLQRAIDNNALSERMIIELLTSDDPAIKSGIQSEDGKRQVLEAALYNMQHSPSGMGPNLPNAQAAANYERQLQQEQAENELYVSHEDDAIRRGQTTINIAPGVSFRGYATPAGFNTGGTAPVANAHGDYIYTDTTTGRKWNASTGKYER